MVREQDLPTSSMERLLKLSGLVGRVGASLATARLLDFVQSGPARNARRTETVVRNAIRIVETLGELKGGAMKLGQMLSLHADALPPEAAEILRALQKEAPRVPAEVMEYEVRGALRGRFDATFASFEPEAFAAASIGQVHRAVLQDGRAVAVKVQYPLIREIIEADLKNLRTLFSALYGLVSDVDSGPVWNEVRDRLREELDYRREAANVVRMAELHRDIPDIVIPRVVEEASSDRVLTLEYVEGMSHEAACSQDTPQELRDRWGRVLFEFQMRGLLTTRFLHADPNLANFGFLPDGRVIVYDFGCVKEIPEPIALGYAELTRAALDGRAADVPTILHDLGVRKLDGAALSRSVTDPYFEVLAKVYREHPPYTFGEEPGFYQRLFDLGVANLGEAVDLVFPHDVVFINRTLSGNFGNLSRLRATADWRAVARGQVLTR